MKLEYQKITSKKLRQELLDFALNEVLEELRIKCFPHQRRPFLLEKVTIRERVYEQKLFDIILGNYEEENNNHLIFVRVDIIKQIHKNKNKHVRLHKYTELKKIIRHELAHAFINERYQFISKLEGVHRDASPIFLSFLRWVNGISGHDCAERFEITNTYENIFDEKYKKFENFDKYLRMTIQQYNKVVDKLKVQNNNNSKDFLQITNNFAFSYYDAGMKKSQEITSQVFNKSEVDLTRVKVISRKWEIGCNVNLENIDTLFNRKQDSKARVEASEITLQTIKNNRIISTKNIRGNN